MRDFDVCALGNAIMDTVVFVEDRFPESLNLRSGIMTLADAKEQGRILEALHGRNLELCSGGSAANSMWALVQSGGKASYMAKLSKDPNGRYYEHELSSHGISLPVELLEENQGPTGTCVVLTTPDAQRTMSTHLGVAVQLSPDDIDPDILKRSRYVYCEGYLWTCETSRAACLQAMEYAKQANVPVALSYSDPFVVETYRKDFLEITEKYCDIVFCNREEARSLSQASDIKQAIAYLQDKVKLAFITDGDKGCHVLHQGEGSHVGGFAAKTIDTNGAGDAFAGGVLYGLANGYDPLASAHWGNYLGSEIVSLHGARLQKDYSNQIKEIIKS